MFDHTRIVLLYMATMGSVRLIFSKLHIEHWDSLNREFAEIPKTLHHALSNDQLDLQDSATIFTEQLHEFLASKNEFAKQTITFYKHKEKRNVEQARKEKNRLKKVAKRSGNAEDKISFLQSRRFYNFLLHEQYKDVNRNENIEPEKLFKKEFWRFAKEACNENLGKEQIKPTFDKVSADRFYKNKYSTPNNINIDELNWFSPVKDPSLNFQKIRITPGQIKQILKVKSATFVPGEDDIMYGMLKNLPSTRHFPATLYNKMLEKRTAPEIWTNSKIILIHKCGDPSIPASFRMIGLSSALIKPFHLILARKLREFMINESGPPKSGQAVLRCHPVREMKKAPCGAKHAPEANSGLLLHSLIAQHPVLRSLYNLLLVLGRYLLPFGRARKMSWVVPPSRCLLQGYSKSLVSTD